MNIEGKELHLPACWQAQNICVVAPEGHRLLIERQLPFLASVIGQCAFTAHLFKHVDDPSTVSLIRNSSKDWMQSYESRHVFMVFFPSRGIVEKQALQVPKLLDS